MASIDGLMKCLVEEIALAGSEGKSFSKFVALEMSFPRFFYDYAELASTQ